MQVKQRRRIQVIEKPSYLFLVLVFFIGLLLSLHWLYVHHSQGDTTGSVNATILPPTTAAIDISKKDPMDFFIPFWNNDPRLKFLPNGETDYFVNDPYQKIETDFRIRSIHMRPRIKFWFDIYAKYSSHFKVIHDRDDLSIIYGVIDFRGLYKNLGKGVTADAIALRIEKKILKEVQSQLVAAATRKAPSSSATDQQNIRTFLSSVGALDEKRAAELVRNLRSQTGQRDMFIQALYRSDTLLPHIEAEFRQKKLPVFLARIPFVESSFNPKALSSVGASGIWQFMPDTARQMISQDPKKWVDPIIQTKGAIRLLQMFKVYLPDWSTTITAYNSGVGRMKKLVQQTKAKHVAEVIGKTDHLGFAGENFYAEVHAANLAEAYKDELFKEFLKFKSDYFVVFKEKLPPELCDL